jgi:5-bromo-4-chloroindolyl phosphate hydrolysis protein
MDKQVVALLIPIVALLIPTVAITANGVLKLARVRLEQIKASAAAQGDGGAELSALRDEVAELRHELSEVHERLDFTERMLTRQREERRLPEG